MKLREPAPRGAFDYLLRDIEESRRQRLDDLVHDAQPPPPPRRDEPEHRRTHVTIEMVPVRQAKKRRGSWTGAIVVWSIVGLILMSLARGQTTTWTSRSEGFLTRLEGIDSQGRNWTGTSYQQGHVTYTETNGPNGQIVRCSSYKQGFQTITRCD